VIRAVVFDLGGTLLDFNPQHIPWPEWERAGLESAHAFLSAQGYDLPTDTFATQFVNGLPELWERATRGQGNLRLGNRLREAYAACGVKLRPEHVRAAIDHYIRPLDARVSIYDDTRDTLKALRERGLAIGLISNTMWPGHYHRRELERYGLISLFDHTAFSADVGIWKPQPGIYRLSLRALGVPPREAVFVGDMPEHDVVGAQRVGMYGVYKRKARPMPSDVRPDAVITHLAELPPLIERW
jgi:putative hydrolase of the HAD superfamily